jgi:hypothetical protein
MGAPPHPPTHGLISEPLPENTEPIHDGKARDPNDFPTFTSRSLTKPVSTVLYLPPLLSSLPRGLPAPPISTDRPPLVSDNRLPDIDPVSVSLHKALHHFRPLTDDYARFPYAHAFNWSELELPEDEEREWYAVVFRSKRRLGSDSGRKCSICIHRIRSVGLTFHAALYEADKKAHEEAVSNGGVSSIHTFTRRQFTKCDHFHHSSLCIGTAYQIRRRE